jgi:Domain of unknown function (DUF4266)
MLLLFLRRCRGVLFLGVVFLNACAQVAPWQRGDLAKPEMSMQPQPQLQSFRDHIFTAREAAQGGHIGAGGGCGCN